MTIKLPTIIWFTCRQRQDFKPRPVRWKTESSLWGDFRHPGKSRYMCMRCRYIRLEEGCGWRFKYDNCYIETEKNIPCGSTCAWKHSEWVLPERRWDGLVQGFSIFLPLNYLPSCNDDDHSMEVSAFPFTCCAFCLLVLSLLLLIQKFAGEKFLFGLPGGIFSSCFNFLSQA